LSRLGLAAQVVLDLLVVSDDVVGRLDGHLFKRSALARRLKVPACLLPGVVHHSNLERVGDDIRCAEARRPQLFSRGIRDRMFESCRAHGSTKRFWRSPCTPKSEH
jgi:hypothetical protein